MDRQTDDADLVRDGAFDGLPDPPGGIGAEFEAPLILELFDGPDEAEVPFLDNVGKGKAPVDVALADGHHEPEVRLDHVFARFRVACLDAFGQGLFLFKGKELRNTDFLQVHLDRIEIFRCILAAAAGMNRCRILMV